MLEVVEGPHGEGAQAEGRVGEAVFVPAAVFVVEGGVEGWIGDVDFVGADADYGTCWG